MAPNKWYFYSPLSSKCSGWGVTISYANKLSFCVFQCTSRAAYIALLLLKQMKIQTHPPTRFSDTGIQVCIRPPNDWPTQDYWSLVISGPKSLGPCPWSLWLPITDKQKPPMTGLQGLPDETSKSPITDMAQTLHIMNPQWWQITTFQRGPLAAFHGNIE